MTSISTVLSDAHLRAIGNVAVQWSILEYHMEQAIWALGSLATLNGRALTAQMGNKMRRDVIESLANEFIVDEALRDRLDKILSNVKELGGERNRVVHALWGSTSTPNAARAHTTTSYGTTKTVAKDWTPDEIDGLSARISKVSNDIRIILPLLGSWVQWATEEPLTPQSRRTSKVLPHDSP